MQKKVYETAKRPEEIAGLLLQRLNTGDYEGCALLYEPDAALATGASEVARGHQAISNFYKKLLASHPVFKPALSSAPLLQGDLALTSSRLDDGTVTVEVARRQADGTWLYVIDQPNFLDTQAR